MTEVVEVGSTAVVGVVEVDQQVIELATNVQAVIEVGYTQPGGTLGDAFFSQAFDTQDTITVTHNLGKQPSVVVVDTAGTVFLAGVQYVNDNVCIVTMNAPTTGTIYCN